MLKIKLWGTRGSIPVPGSDTVKYGGNTASVELRVGEENRLVIIDAGTGIRLLANKILQEDLPRGPLKFALFFTHTHWDHIMGFPFFVPIFIPGTEINIYGPVTYEDETLDNIIGGQLQYRYFPVKQSELSAKISYTSLRECVLDMGGGLIVRTKYLNHPILCLGYRFEYNGKSFCTLYDHEPFRNLFPTDPEDPSFDAFVAEEGEAVAREQNKKVEDFLRGADLVLYDSQYTEEEYVPAKLGWGHSTFDAAVAAGIRSNVKELLLVHHDPMRTDSQLDELERYCKEMAKGESEMKVSIAREGQEIRL